MYLYFLSCQWLTVCRTNCLDNEDSNFGSSVHNTLSKPEAHQFSKFRFNEKVFA